MNNIHKLLIAILGIVLVMACTPCDAGTNDQPYTQTEQVLEETPRVVSVSMISLAGISFPLLNNPLQDCNVEDGPCVCCFCWGTCNIVICRIKDKPGCNDDDPLTPTDPVIEVIENPQL